MSTVFKIYSVAAGAWHDYSSTVKRSGFGWSRNDLDGDNAGRTLDGIMHRAKIGAKRKISFELMPDRQAVYQALDDDLSQETFSAQYADLHGIQTRTFYCSSFTATLDEDIGDAPEWSGGSFSVIEV
jgi:hypothetical protein